MGSRKKKRVKKTVEAMINLYCLKVHGTESGLCTDCFEVLEYSIKRTDNCVSGADKPPCEKCPVHCYKKGMREKIKTIMRFSGPQIMFVHPWFAFMHIIDKMTYRKVEKRNS